MTLRRNPLAIGLGVLLASTGAASPQLFGDLPAQPGSVYRLNVDSASSAPFGRGAAGRLTGDRISLVMLREDQLYAMIGPGAYESSIEAFYTANDFTRVPGAAGGADDLIVVGPTGLNRLTFDIDLPELWSVTTIDDGPWVGARRVAVVPSTANPSGATEILGLGAGGTTVLSTPSGGGVAEILFTLPGPASEFELVQADGDSDLEIAVAVGDVVSVYDRSGTLLATSGPTGKTNLALTSIAQTSGSEQRVAWFFRGGANEFIGGLGIGWVAVLQNFQAINGIVACAPVDFDNDGLDDIAVNITSAPLVGILRNLGDATLPAFDATDPGGRWILDYGLNAPPAPGASAQPVCADVDGDGDQDVLLPVGLDGSLYVHLNALVDEDTLKPEVDDNQQLEGAPLVLAEEGGSFWFRMHLRAPDNPEAVALEASLFRKESPSQPTESEYDVLLLPKPSPCPDGCSFFVEFELSDDEMPMGGLGFNAIYFVLLRWVPAPGDSRVFPTRVYGLQSERLTNHNYLLSRQGVDPIPLFVDYQYDGGGTSIDKLTTVIEGGCLPPVSPNQPPRPR